MAGEEIDLDEDWDWHLRGGPDRNRGAVLIPGADCYAATLPATT